ncbi:hypothetical protein HanPI659440_Chr17g0700551 [Helianthus annuus]|nr:hypothetical protein HanPI659440_Chr17g0700551 [Helianthus annuus]
MYIRRKGVGIPPTPVSASSPSSHTTPLHLVTSSASPGRRKRQACLPLTLSFSLLHPWVIPKWIILHQCDVADSPQKDYPNHTQWSKNRMGDMV